MTSDSGCGKRRVGRPPKYHYPKRPGIYAIRNLITGECYVGKSKHLQSRIIAHLNQLFAVHPNKLLADAVKKHGPFTFGVDVLELCDREKLSDREWWWTKKLNSTYNALAIARMAKH